MAALVILVNADADVLWKTDALLSQDGHLVAAVSTIAEGRKLLESVTPDVLIADVRLGAYNGLQLAIRSRLDHPSLPVIITNEWPDPTFEAEAKRQGAIFVAAPLDNPDFLQIVRSAIAQSRRTQPAIRRWLRKQVAGTVQVNAGDAQAQLVDMSHGGVRLAFSQQADIPAVFDITVPEVGITLKAHRVWTGRSFTTDEQWCGAELEGTATPSWRNFVDSLAGGTAL
jgi:DNA-binding NarL/FixJ family response regulator